MALRAGDPSNVPPGLGPDRSHAGSNLREAKLAPNFYRYRSIGTKIKLSIKAINSLSRRPEFRLVDGCELYSLLHNLDEHGLEKGFMVTKPWAIELLVFRVSLF